MSEKEDVQLKDLEKGEAEIDNSTEKSPLKETDKDHEATGGGDDVKDQNNGIKEIKANPLLETLRDPKTRVTVAIIAAVLLLVVVAGIVISVLVMGSHSEPEPWVEDPVPRMLRLVPTPNGAMNTITFRSGHGSEGRIWPNLTEEIANLFEKYDEKNVMGKKNVTNCANRVTPPGDEKLTCLFEVADILKQCPPDKQFGYADGAPCLFVQFNHVHNFTPEVYTKQDLEDASLPESLRSGYQFKGPWVECRGNEVVDVENAGPIKIFPMNELPRFSFPYKGHPDYMAPFIALKLEKPKTAVTIGITCRLWARNVMFNATTSGFNDTLVDDAIVPSAILPFNLFIE